MIVPKHKICDLCGRVVGINIRYFIIKSKCFYVSYAGSVWLKFVNTFVRKKVTRSELWSV